jgi:nitrogen fixation/metabolism regulation signal transduction histidine kinase
MDARSLRNLVYTVLAAVGLVLALSALMLLAKTSQNSAELDRLSQFTLVINGAGIAVLFALLVGNIWRLIRDLRKRVPGARLTGRMVTAFVGLAVLPLVVVYYFSLQFINRGIDSWFSVQVESGLIDALELSRAAMDVQMRGGLARTVNIASRLEAVPPGALLASLARERRESDALELTVFAQNSRILAISSQRAVGSIPAVPGDEVLLQIRSSRPFVSLDPVAGDGYEIRIAVPLGNADPAQPLRVLQAIYPVTQRLSSMANSVDQSYTDYQRLVFLRGPLKRTFTLSLTVVLLVSVLAAIYGAFFFARRLVHPIQQLVAGTEAVAQGDFETELTQPTRDEMGVLVASFNDMTRRLRAASTLAQRSQALVEAERANLEIILARLSTGVIALTPDLDIRIANRAAGSILGVDLDNRAGESLAVVAEEEPMLRQLVDVAQRHFNAGETEWREQIVLRETVGRRVLTCACTALPAEGPESAGNVIVFDDITALLQAQRDAAWGEVARRLAHEIKNPLTPIQLSAERLRRKYLATLPAADAQVLDRATHTIVQQVEAMKEMVNAFSDYARAPNVEITQFRLNRLVSEVVDLYRSEDRRVTIRLDLAASDPVIEADNGRLRQIIHNLLRNAVEALEAQDNGLITVSTSTIDRDGQTFAAIVVEDNGPGFQNSRVEQIFDPYVTSKPKGTGLGLAIVKKLVEEHAGIIEAGNREGGGARLSILLPLNEGAREAMLRQQHRQTARRRDSA